MERPYNPGYLYYEAQPADGSSKDTSWSYLSQSRSSNQVQTQAIVGPTLEPTIWTLTSAGYLKQDSGNLLCTDGLSITAQAPAMGIYPYVCTQGHNVDTMERATVQNFRPGTKVSCAAGPSGAFKDIFICASGEAAASQLACSSGPTGALKVSQLVMAFPEREYATDDGRLARIAHY